MRSLKSILGLTALACALQAAAVSIEVRDEGDRRRAGAASTAVETVRGPF